eukprot:scaffold216208_cov34-Prasinocladus_malaysianus.AAC.1
MERLIKRQQRAGPPHIRTCMELLRVYETRGVADFGLDSRARTRRARIRPCTELLRVTRVADFDSDSRARTR